MDRQGKPGGWPPPGTGDGERRRESRGRQAPAYLTSPVSGVVTNLGRGGFCVETWEPLAVKRRYWMRIGESGVRGARVCCRVEWCRLVRTDKTGNGDVVSIYRLGVSYLGFDERDRVGD